MIKKKYKNPKITINKVYTKKGDRGSTYLIGNQKVSKHHIRIKAYGELDELNAIVGGCRQILIDDKSKDKSCNNLIKILKNIQNKIFNLGYDKECRFKIIIGMFFANRCVN